MQLGHPMLMQHLPINPHRTLSFQKPNRIRNTALRQDVQAQMNMVTHRVPFQQPNPFLFTQIPQDCTYRSPKLPIDS